MSSVVGANKIYISIFVLLTSLLSRFLSVVSGRAEQIGSAELRHCVESKVRASSVEELAWTLETANETLKLIIDGLTQPPGFDIRQSKSFVQERSRLQ